jgi:Domain of unknown function (DUF4908)
MRWFPESARALATSAAGAALVLFAAGGAASAPDVAPSRILAGTCPSSLAGTLGPTELFKCFYQASIRASRAAGHSVGFETATNPSEETAPAFAYAATVTSQVLVSIAGRAGGKAFLARIEEVVFVVGAEPSASLVRGVLTITLVPSRKLAGRPSMRKIEDAARLT